MACQEMRFLDAQRLLDQGANPNVLLMIEGLNEKWTALTTSTANGQIRIVRLLVSSGADPDQPNGVYYFSISLCAVCYILLRFASLRVT